MINGSYLNSQNALIATMLLTIVGCTSVPSVPKDLTIVSDNELCESFGIAYAAKDTNNLSKILEEGDKRGITENDICKMFMELGMKKYAEARNEPSAFSSFIGTVDAIGSAGHTKNHNVTIK